MRQRQWKGREKEKKMSILSEDMGIVKQPHTPRDQPRLSRRVHAVRQGQTAMQATRAGGVQRDFSVPE